MEDDWLERAAKTTLWIEENLPRAEASRSGRRRSGSRRLARPEHSVSDAARVEDAGGIGRLVSDLDRHARRATQALKSSMKQASQSATRPEARSRAMARGGA